jgi:hypothetical protein
MFDSYSLKKGQVLESATPWGNVRCLVNKRWPFGSHKKRGSDLDRSSSVPSERNDGLDVLGMRLCTPI